MAKYKYQVQEIPEAWNAQDVEDAINQAGQNGWLVHGLYTLGKAPNEKFFVIAIKQLVQ